MREIAGNYPLTSNLLECQKINFCMPPGHLIGQQRFYFHQIGMADEENRFLGGKLNPDGALI